MERLFYMTSQTLAQSGEQLLFPIVELIIQIGHLVTRNKINVLQGQRLEFYVIMVFLAHHSIVLNIFALYLKKCTVQYDKTHARRRLYRIFNSEDEHALCWGSAFPTQ